MKSFVQLSIEEYEDLKEKANQKDIPIELESVYAGSPVYVGTVPILTPSKTTVKINMRELKLQICRQNGIDPEKTTVEFY